MAKTWGENLGARFGLGFMLFLLNLPTIALVFLAVLGGPTLMAILLPIAVIYGVFTALLAQTAKSVLTVVLYHYASTGEGGGGFERSSLSDAFGSR